MAGVFELYATINLDTGEYKTQLKEAGKITSDTAKQIDAKSVAIGNMVADMARKGGEFFVKMAKTGVQYNAQIETYAAALTTALGNEADAAAAIEKIKTDAARTPYSVDGLVKANMYLISAGESADDSREAILALTDAVSATGGGNEELQRMAQNLQQIKNAGKAAEIDLKQFASAGIAIWPLLTEYTGKSQEELKKVGVTYEMITGALKMAASEGGRFYEANLRQSQTLNGQWSTFSDNVHQKLGEAFESVSNTIQGNVLPAANRFVESFDISKAINNIKSAALVIGGLVGPFVAVDKAAKLAAKSTELFNSILAAGPWTIVAAGFAVVAAEAINYNNALNDMIAAEHEYGESSEEVAAHLDELRAKYDELAALAAEGYTESIITDQMGELRLQIMAAEERFDELTAAEAAAADGAEGVADGAETAGDALDALADSTDTTTTALAEIVKSYDKLYDNISKKVNGWFGLFDQAKVNVKTSVKDMMDAMRSQIDFNTSYSANLQYLADNGLSSLGSAFQGMGAEGSVYAATIVQAIEDAGGAASEGGQEIIRSFSEVAAGVESSRSELTGTLTDLTGTVEEAFADWGATAEQAAEALNVADAAGSAAAASVAAYIAGLAGGAGGAFSAAASVARSASAGFASVGGGAGGRPLPKLAVGSDYIPYDDFPALLHKGEMVVPAKISEDLRDFLGAGNRSPQSGGFGDMREVTSLLRELISATRRPIVLEDGTLVGSTASKMNNALGNLDELGGRGLCIA